MKGPARSAAAGGDDFARAGGKATAATLVYRRLKGDLLRGALAPGERLQVEQIALRYGAGTNPVREAMNRLAAERMVDHEDQRGFSVPVLSIEQFRDIVKARCWLEGRALVESVRNRTEAWEDGIVLALHRLLRTPFLFGTDAQDADDNREWEVRHRQFHRALISNCGSEWLLRFCEELMDQAERYRYISDSNTYPRRNSEEEHRRISDAALRGDAEAAAEHLVAQYQLTLELYEAKVRAAGPAGDEGRH
ncbi:GntR family transcriptional regulator [Amaricoccus sp.]|uniref:GntR family transcriptional regulator n=1 Tax=Amaricoccus sp. TaxID=1872485 RepID=UPI002619C0FD|nr:GntR family transcriptional regulator [Amaricoccus sp.]HRO10669.1 GntR family transcriptional regulator [Amaricoccus sp.]